MSGRLLPVLVSAGSRVSVGGAVGTWVSPSGDDRDEDIGGVIVGLGLIGADGRDVGQRLLELRGADLRRSAL